MKKSMTTLMFVLACCLFATIPGNAQSSMSGDSMKNDSTMKHGKMMSMTGCIAEQNGKYMMMNKAHPDGVQLMSSEDLKPHIGHKVRVRGTMEKMDDSMGMMDMKVTSMKMISTHCDMSSMTK